MSRKCNDALRDLYNRHAINRNAADRPLWKNEERKYALDAFQEKGCASLLEIGSGTCQDSLFFKQHGLEVTAIDFAEEQVKCCRIKQINAIVMDVYSLTFEPEAFDCIYSINCFLHIPKQDLPGVLQGVQRILKPGGLFYLGVYGGRNFEGMLKWTDHQEKRFFSLFEFQDYSNILKPLFCIKHSREIRLAEDLLFHAFLLAPRIDTAMQNRV